MRSSKRHCTQRSQALPNVRRREPASHLDHLHSAMSKALLHRQSAINRTYVPCSSMGWIIQSSAITACPGLPDRLQVKAAIQAPDATEPGLFHRLRSRETPHTTQAMRPRCVLHYQDAFLNVMYLIPRRAPQLRLSLNRLVPICRRRMRWTYCISWNVRTHMCLCRSELGDLCLDRIELGTAFVLLPHNQIPLSHLHLGLPPRSWTRTALLARDDLYTSDPCSSMLGKTAANGRAASPPKRADRFCPPPQTRSKHVGRRPTIILR